MPHAFIALGYRDTAEALPEDLRNRERPSSRHRQSEWIIEDYKIN